MVIRATVPLEESEVRAFLHRFLFSGDDVLTSRDNFEQALAGYEDTVLMVVHDRYATRLWVVEGDRVRAYADRVNWMRV